MQASGNVAGLWREGARRYPNMRAIVTVWLV
ncbi:MAG: hypothetical protein QOJ12_1054, partial [Thermoleophilales bacterium]|nr:hypothetical protein [Thermoleophilales bacterium]